MPNNDLSSTQYCSTSALTCTPAGWLAGAALGSSGDGKRKRSIKNVSERFIPFILVKLRKLLSDGGTKFFNKIISLLASGFFENVYLSERGAGVLRRVATFSRFFFSPWMSVYPCIVKLS